MEKPEDEDLRSEPPDLFDAFPELRPPDYSESELQEMAKLFDEPPSPDPEESSFPRTETQDKEWHEECESENRKIDNEQRERRAKSFWTTFLIGLVLGIIVILSIVLQPKDHSLDRRPGETRAEYQSRMERTHDEEPEQDLSGGSHGF